MLKESILRYQTELQDIRRKHDKIKNYYYKQKGRKEQLTEQRLKLEKTLQSCIDNIELLEKVRILLGRVSEFAREQARIQIESLVTNCLQYIFDTNLEFGIEINEVRGRPEAEFFVISNFTGQVIKTKPQEARGGGVIDIISLAIRIAMLECSDDEIKGPVILDEPAKHVSDDYIVQVSEFLKQVTLMFKRQVIMVTHNKHLSEMADKWYKVEMVDGVSIVKTDEAEILKNY
ncbi:ATPase [Herbivorax sp. ANBcel31]|uniref:ATPase n=1 Tax=Herbivorax sp. ANBcel31 TaxID=3069754 RepID=UPI0027B6685D|nr:ATPase [Herbivorax sp. ANBcel31]MDQ2085960.1 ATPase [Herbivorax sp. ANBcel31]